jgi:hypothetical protein
MQGKIILLLSLPLATLVAIVSCVGLLTPGFYSAETLNWQAQSLGQDMVDLVLITPCLIITSFLSWRNNKAATMIWGGVVLYLTYTFVLYSFNVHFNRLFVLYCFSLGLSFYSLIYFLSQQYKVNLEQHFEKKSLTRFVGIYFITIAVMFYFLWLAEIVPSIIQNTIPASVTDTGLFTNGVQVIDLAIILPAIFIAGIFLWKQISFGLVLAPVFLTFFVLMDITIAILAVVMKSKGVESDLNITLIMSILALVSLVILIWFLKSTKPVFFK